jgi:elongation factor Ts
MNMSVTPKMIKELRDETSAGFMDCKNALEQANGDLEAARQILRERGVAIAGKRAGRDTNQGIIVGRVSDDGRTGVLVDLRCETDFVARNEEFMALADNLISQVLAHGQNGEVSEMLDLPYYADASWTVAQAIEQAIGRTGENIRFARYAVVKVSGDGLVDAYIHHNKRVGVLVALTGSTGEEALRNLAHEIAIQVAWSAPTFVTREEVPAEVIEREIEIEKQRALNEGKPENIAANIAQGRVNKDYIQKAVLLEQPYYRDNALTIGKLMAQTGSDTQVQCFVRLEVGA